MANKHMRMCSISLVTREIQIKTTTKHCFTPTRMAIIKNQEKNNVGEDVVKLEPFYIAGGNVK